MVNIYENFSCVLLLFLNIIYLVDRDSLNLIYKLFSGYSPENYRFIYSLYEIWFIAFSNQYKRHT